MSKPTVFQKPIEVSEELSNFLGLPDGELIARTEVTSKINDYCKKHNLQNPNDKRVIIPNDTLRKSASRKAIK